MHPEIFVRLLKVDASDPDSLKIEGLATSGKQTDRGGERLHYPKSKPYFGKWGEELWQSTGGKSRGNLREQHDPTRAIGLVSDLIFDDAREEIRIVGKIVDKEAIRKTLAGVYSCLSIAGRYVKRWTEDNINWFICEPSEISICDFGALPGATFDVVNKSGAVERRQFQHQGDTMNRSDHQECARRSLAMAEHHEALGKLHREAHTHHSKMMNDGTADGPKAAESDFEKYAAKYANLDTPMDPAGGLRKWRP